MGMIKDRVQQDIKNVSYSLADTQLLSLLGADTNMINGQKLGEVVFFTCLNFLSNSISKLPIYKYSLSGQKGREKIIDPVLENILNLETNEYMSASTFWACVELNRNFFGNAYVYIKYDNKAKIESMWILPSEEVTVWRDTAGIFGKTNAIWYVWFDGNNSGKKYSFASNEILHYKTSTSWDGIMGVPVKDILSQQIETQKYGQGYVNNLYKNNMLGNKIMLQYTGDMSPGSKDSLIKETEKYCNSNSSKFLPLPMTIKATELAMKLSDNEFSVINNTNSLRLCAAFGLSPNIINDYSKSSYANSISQKVDFYTDALSPILNQYKQENTRKLISKKDRDKGIFLESDVKSLFKLDPVAQMQYLKDGINNLLITPNEAREELGYSWIAGGDVLLGQGGLAPLEILKTGANYNKNSGTGGGENINAK